MEKASQPPESVDTASIAAAVQRLGKNAGGYFGEVIHIESVLAEQQQWALTHGWRIESIVTAPGLSLPVFRRTPAQARRRLYLSTGIHGDEPAGPLAMRELLKENCWPADADLWLCPCLNPTGFPRNTRQSADGIDLNRDYKSLRSPEVRAHVAWLDQQPGFDLTLCLHEDWEAHGFYVYEVNPDDAPSLAPKMIEAVRPFCPIDPSTLIDEREAKDGIIRPNLDPLLRLEWAEAFYLYVNKTRLSYTLEAPSDFPLTVRVAALVAAAKAALHAS
jgi:protein MpaA